MRKSNEELTADKEARSYQRKRRRCRRHRRRRRRLLVPKVAKVTLIYQNFPSL